MAGCAQLRDLSSRFHGAIGSIGAGRVRMGDDLRWASPQWNDAQWTEAVLYGVQPRGRTLWIRQRVKLPVRSDDQVLCVYTAMIASSEVYWDGRLLGRSGAIGGDGIVVRPGPLDNFFPIPREAAAAGVHLLAIRVALPPALIADLWFQGIVIGDYEPMLRSRIVGQVLPLAGCGIFLVIGVYYFALYFAAGRRKPLMVFALLCFAAALLATTESWRWTIGYTYDWHIVRLMLVSLFTFAVSLLLPLYFVFDFLLNRPFRWLFATVAVLMTAAISDGSFDGGCLAMFAASVGVCAVAIAAGVRRRRWHVIPAVIGTTILGICLLAGGYGFNDNAFFFAFGAVIIVLLMAMALDIRRERREHDGTILRAARLEIALLQKSIQPHFVMNTLTAAMEWIEQSPEEGVRFLEAFADQLRIFAEVSSEASIPIARELALCRAHLMVMSGRKGTRFVLRTDGVDESATIPPAVFHTLIENAITHNRYGQTEVVFALREERLDGIRRYILDAPVTGAPGSRNADGTGLRYVKARLQENYPGLWRCDARADKHAWTTTIEVPA
jgi:hypothetical protein